MKSSQKDASGSAGKWRAIPQPGFILADASLRILGTNPEAMQIVCYPGKPDGVRRIDRFLPQDLKTKLFDPEHARRMWFTGEAKSGRRHYSCRVFVLNRSGTKQQRRMFAVLLERNRPAAALLLSNVLEQFNLTPRERQVVELLSRGFTSKEIAARMNISANTVKAFLRLIMVKMGVSTRSGVVGKAVLPDD
jgi:DNA-binding CsgD family transcriptional regulator